MSATDGRRARLSSRRSLASPEQTEGSRKTVLIALASNAAIAIIKAIGGLMSGSAALLAEAAHPIPDTTNPALQQTRGEAREAGKSLWRYVRESRDPNAKMVLFEDSAALVGVAIAATGIGIDQLTGSSVFDPIASVLIGVLLVGVAVWMARDT